VYVDAGELTAAIRSELAAEAPATTFGDQPEGADLVVRLVRRLGSLELRVSSGQDAILVERSIGIEQDPAPALRVAVLLIAEVVLAREPPPAAPLEEEAAPSPIRLAGGGSLGWWGEPGAAQIALWVAGAVALGWMQVGLQLEISPLLSIDKPGVGSGDVHTGTLVGTAEIDLLSLGAPVIRLALAAGASLRSFHGEWALPISPPSRSPQSYTDLEVVGRGGLGLAWPLGPELGLRARTGIELRGSTQALVVPEGYEGSGLEIGPGPVGPWVEVGLEWTPF
jgi:hypothetical protein